MQPFERQTAYGADITYGTNNEFGFDYLRDNMVTDQYDKVQRELNFAVVDEVDSILIDEARTPLIISGQADDNIQLYRVMNAVPAHLIRQETEEGEGDYWVDEKAHQVILSEAGHEHAEQILTQMGLLQEKRFALLCRQYFPDAPPHGCIARAHPVPQRPTLRHPRRRNRDCG